MLPRSRETQRSHPYLQRKTDKVDITQFRSISPLANASKIFERFLLMAASASLPAIIALLLQFKEFELYWGAVFLFKICPQNFMIFEVKLE